MKFMKTKEERAAQREYNRKFWSSLRPRGTVLENIAGPTGDVDVDYDSEELMALVEKAQISAKNIERKKKAEQKRLEHSLRYMSYGTVITNLSGGRKDEMTKPINWMALMEKSEKEAKKRARKQFLNRLMFKR